MQDSRRQLARTARQVVIEYIVHIRVPCHHRNRARRTRPFRVIHLIEVQRQIRLVR
jgi:hypothetical protein